MRPSEDPADYEFDIAVSFAGEDRSFVEDVIRVLDEQGDEKVRVFYDRNYRYEAWGKDLIEHFSHVYLKRARYVVMFISAAYAEKEWTRLERRTSLMRALRQKTEYILPVRLDNTELEDLQGFLPSTHYLHADEEGSEGVAAGVRYKLGNATATRPPMYRPQVAKSARELKDLVAVQPPAWEHLLWASVLSQGREALADQRRDHELEYGPPNGNRVTDLRDVIATVQATITDLDHIVHVFNKVLAPTAFQKAVGAPGVSGDPDDILHIGQRFVDLYGRLLQISANLRGTAVPTEYAHVLDMAARLADKPLRGIDAFLEELIPPINALPARLEAGETVNLSFMVKIHMDNELLEQIIAEINKSEDE
jgi:hypothetical protein